MRLLEIKRDVVQQADVSLHIGPRVLARGRQIEGPQAIEKHARDDAPERPDQAGFLVGIPQTADLNRGLLVEDGRVTVAYSEKKNKLFYEPPSDAWPLILHIVSVRPSVRHATILRQKQASIA